MSSDTKAVIHEFENRRYAAMCQADVATLAALLADSLVYTHSSGSTDSKSSYLEGVRSKKWQYQKIERPVEDIQVNGDCAIVTGQVRIEVLINGTSKVLNSRYINVWIKGSQGWQMAAWQSTPIAA